MRFEYRLPDIGEGLESAEIVNWLVEAGQPVRRDQPLVVVETDKAAVDMPSPGDGVLVELGGGPGDVLRIGEVLAVLDLADADAPAPTAPAPAAPAAAAARPKAAPAIRRLATELGVDLHQVDGTGPGGRVQREDVLAAASPSPVEQEPPAPPVPEERGDERVALRGLRRQIAQRMAEAWRTIPHMTDLREVDATELVRARDALSATAPVTYLPLVVKVVATALRTHRSLNASIDLEAEEIILRGAVNIGIATAIDGGLVVPVIRDADTKSVFEIAAEAEALAEAARARRLTPAQLAGGTFTVNNIGAIGGTRAVPIIRHPEVCILAFGRITKRPVVVDDQIVIRWMMDLSTVADHRIVDGGDLSAFLATVSALLADPVRLLGELR